MLQQLAVIGLSLMGLLLWGACAGPSPDDGVPLAYEEKLNEDTQELTASAGVCDCSWGFFTCHPVVDNCNAGFVPDCYNAGIYCACDCRRE